MKEELNEKYKLTDKDLEIGKNRILTEVYASCDGTENPELVFICAGPGAGKTSLENYLSNQFEEKGKNSYYLSSDNLAKYHPQYSKILKNELPGDVYTLTRQFVRPVSKQVFEDLRNHKINIVNETTLSKKESDINLVKAFKDAGYKVKVNIMATDLFESRMSCFEREAREIENGLTPRGCSKENQLKMYSSFVDSIKALDKMGLLDDIVVCARGENINKPPKIVYKKGDNNFRDFEEAMNYERNSQRKALLEKPYEYYRRIDEAERIVSENSGNEELAKNTMDGLEELRSDFSNEIEKNKEGQGLDD